jgi:nitrite reductase (NADH) large subunit
MMVKKIVGAELAKSGATISSALCEHFDMSRRQLFDAVRVSGLTTFSAVIARFGRGRGCDICKPTLASILATLVHAHVLDGENATLQDTNDHVMANLQKDGSYSVVPRIAGGEITPEGLLVIGQVAKDFNLYTKITGGQRIDMFGARLEQLPDIWRRLVDAGFESGHAYGKSLRTVKSCVGSTWCRYGVQDSVGMAVRLELRYRGLRSPHKLKLGVSGCARECAEARGKDVGVIATENGWNMYVGGNGGFTPRHAVLLAEGLDDDALIAAIDRFLMYYIFTADRLQRTAPWLEELDGGLDGLRAVILDDSLGVCADLDDAMAAHIGSYEDEWRATIQDPERLRRFASFVNAPPDPGPLARLRRRARSTTAGIRGGTRGRARPHRRHDTGGAPMTITQTIGTRTDATTWLRVCEVSELETERGRAALVGGSQVALFLTHDGQVHAVANRDPFSGANVIARGIVGTRGDAPTVASPMYKQVFDLRTGRCLDAQGKDPQHLRVWSVTVENGDVLLEVDREETS